MGGSKGKDLKNKVNEKLKTKKSLPDLNKLIESKSNNENITYSKN